jgi:uncharacterized peroxidase-related enzyme
MAYIKMIPEEDADEVVSSLYEKHRAPWGGVDHILKIHSLLPHTLQPHYDLYKSLMYAQGPLTRPQREMIATVVSASNGCSYCIHHHSDALLRLTKDRILADAIRTDYRTAPLTNVERLMLEFAVQLSTEPTQNFSTWISKLRKNNLTDEAILHTTLIVAYFNFVNRIANGLGVELESYWQKDGYSDPRKSMAHDDQ